MASQLKDRRTIVVSGDITRDWNIVQHPGWISGTTSWQVQREAQISPQPGGAALLVGLVQAVLDHDSVREQWQVFGPTLPQSANQPFDESVHQSFATWSLFPSEQTAGQLVWRLSEHLGLDRSGAGDRGDSRDVRPDTPTPALLVIDDAGLGFRDDPGRWPASLQEDGAQPWIILKMGSPLLSGSLWKHLYRRHLDQLVIVVSINTLREGNVQISRGLSWERTAQDLVWELVYNPVVNALSQARALIVSLGTAGALLVTPGTSATFKHSLIFDPATLEGEWEAARPGGMLGYTTTLAAALTYQILCDPDRPQLATGIQHGLTGMRLLHEHGYEFTTQGERPILRFPFQRIADALVTAETRFTNVTVPDPSAPAPERRSVAGDWTILEDTHSGELSELAAEIVRAGAQAALHDVPFGRFGALLTVDRREIESFRSIRALIAEYALQRQRRPLSIAAFGAPGAGKSFGITQVAESILPGQLQVLTFNLSQFREPEELWGALHQVRDAALSGKLPLVFWDEFDAALGAQAYGWLRSFLAPMQDGTFLEGQINHPIGRAIFVFAGGTSSRMEHFGDTVDPTTFRAAKGPDFLSRLQGYVNVIGPDPSGGAQDEAVQFLDTDPYAIIRRAILLRSILERNAPQVVHDTWIEIDPGVLRGFLLTRRYKHGVRSMEAIVTMSMLTGHRRYERSSLPPAAQLDLHVDCHDFMARVQQLEISGELLERLARETHAVYGEMGIASRDGRLDYDELSEEAREQNRAVVRDIPAKLADMGYVMLPARDGSEPFALPDADLERLAIREHKRYVRDLLARGWRYGPERDDERRIHPALVPWNAGTNRAGADYTLEQQARIGSGPLPDEEKEKDRALVRAIPLILRQAGYTIVPAGTTEVRRN